MKELKPCFKELMEKERMTRKLSKHGNKVNTKDLMAKELGMSRATLYRKHTELDIK
ncbi:MAG: hypothetical protein JJE17_10285 [Peptostreptococcaceae bacterium]|nr:hypothetical protein [Peptostreptococcaceae bacterium]